MPEPKPFKLPDDNKLKEYRRKIFDDNYRIKFSFRDAINEIIDESKTENRKEVLTIAKIAEKSKIDKSKMSRCLRGRKNGNQYRLERLSDDQIRQIATAFPKDYRYYDLDYAVNPKHLLEALGELPVGNLNEVNEALWEKGLDVYGDVRGDEEDF